jgi:hypothetical protein
LTLNVWDVVTIISDCIEITKKNPKGFFFKKYIDQIE